jgi:cell division septal protein FtsQ
MSQRRSKILGLIIFLIILSTLSFVALMPAKKQDGKQIKSINLFGNYLLPQDSYLKFAMLNEARNSTEITLTILKARLEKHPFVNSVEVVLSEFNNAKVNIYEKNPVAILIANDQTFLLSDELQLLPLFSNTKLIDLPIINNPKYVNQYRVLEYVQHAEIIEAYNILYAIKNLNEEMFKNLSEINLNSVDDITLTFSGIRPLIKFGRNEIPKKVLSLNSIWFEIKDESNELSQSDYVDLRFTNQIYFGKAEELKKEI